MTSAGVIGALTALASGYASLALLRRLLMQTALALYLLPYSSGHRGHLRATT